MKKIAPQAKKLVFGVLLKWVFENQQTIKLGGSLKAWAAHPHHFITRGTDERMDERDSLGLQRLRRETKKLANSNERIAKKKCENLHFEHFWPKRPIFEVFGQNGQNRNFFKKVLGTFFRSYKQ